MASSTSFFRKFSETFLHQNLFDPGFDQRIVARIFFAIKIRDFDGAKVADVKTVFFLF
jgi:hypothetical protein